MPQKCGVRVNAREKFHGIMGFELDTPNMKTEFGYWAGAVRRWFEEGLPVEEDIPHSVLDGDLVRGSEPLFPGSGELVDHNVMEVLGLDSYLGKFPIDLSPPLEPEILEEDGSYRVIRDRYGVTKKQLKGSAATHFTVDYPIENRGDFHRYIERYDRDFHRRLPANVEELRGLEPERSLPIRLGGNPYGFSFFPRYLMGDERYMLNLYDDPDLIGEFNRFFLDFVMEYWAVILEWFDVDCVMILEDMAYRGGSMISPEMFDKFLAPYYRELTGFLRSCGIEHIFVDCDGFVERLVPRWIDAGVTGIFPVEAVNDLVSIAEQYPRLRIMGGIDKRALFSGRPEPIDTELRRIEPLLARGGYVPHIDHAVSQDIGWETFKYYRVELNRMIDGRIQ
jgi:uroporphyrinogen decarboxylase